MPIRRKWDPNRSGSTRPPKTLNEDSEEALAKRFENVDITDAIDAQMGFVRMTNGAPRVGWMTNLRSALVKDNDWPAGRSAVDFYFLQEDGDRFKGTITFSPYFFIKCVEGKEAEVEEWLRRKHGSTIESMNRMQKEDLDMPNHVSGKRALYLKLSFRNTNDQVKVRNAVTTDMGRRTTDSSQTVKSPSGYIIDIREHDVPYHLRVAIDLDIRCGLWYTVSVTNATNIAVERVKGKDFRPDPIVLAFDIETSKKPLKFPDAQEDPIMMISYMINGRGYLVTNREILSKDLEDFEYTPLPEFKGKFKIYNEKTEASMINRFFTHIQQVQPLIMVSYNGDKFDWPYLEKRAELNGVDMSEVIGMKKSTGAGGESEYMFSYGTHMDCFCWVQRDSYLPAGSQGLKAVAKAKLGYNPLELDPEEMTPLARSDPQTLANYSVSDAVATYYLYMKYVNPFIYSLCNLIPLTPDEVLRKGSGTLCETLLMAEAHKVNVVYPNKHAGESEKFYNGHLLDGETYVGGHVEALEAGVFRSDIKYKFKVDQSTVDRLIDDLGRALSFLLETEGVKDTSLVLNYDKVYDDIKQRLQTLKKEPARLDQPLIYHLDVGAMYPNIILTNRLQPPAMVSEADCAVCDYNVPGKTCQRPMNWTWRGEYFTANKGEYRMIRGQLERERFTLKRASDQPKAFHELTPAEQSTLVSKRLSEYSQKV
jgi:DNA polymerase epsilon subunit 1